MFGDYDTLIRDFEPIARRDRQKIRSRQGSSASANGNGGRTNGGRAKSLSAAVDPVEISYEKWSVIQVDSHSDSADSSGARIHSISAPLSAAGISIFYQSSYMSDFIFVKEWRLNEVISILTAAGFPMYTSDCQVLCTPDVSVPHSPAPSTSLSHTFPPSVPPSVISVPPSETTVKEDQADDVEQKNFASENVIPTAEPRAKSHSPASAGQVRVLPSDLVCVGLDENIDSWGLKVIKLLAYPDLIPTRRRKSRRHPCQTHSRAVVESQPAPELRRKYTPGDMTSDDVQDVQLPDGASDSSDSEEEGEDGYFSHSPRTDQSGSSFYTSEESQQSARSETDVSFSTKVFPASKHVLAMSPLLPAGPRTPLRISTDVHGPALQNDRQQSTSVSPVPSYKVPFFSFTRTAEGCSLTTNVRLLAALFPPHERHVIKCNEALERVVFDGSRRRASDEDDYDEEDVDGDSDSEDDNDLDDELELEDELDEQRDSDDDSLDSMLRCLQIDLSRFGLEKHGLINKFSRVLGESKINHMYSCTLKTANILVDKRNMNYARDLLSMC